jgi:hypothetical protein
MAGVITTTLLVGHIPCHAEVVCCTGSDISRRVSLLLLACSMAIVSQMSLIVSHLFCLLCWWPCRRFQHILADSWHDASTQLTASRSFAAHEMWHAHPSASRSSPYHNTKNAFSIIIQAHVVPGVARVPQAPVILVDASTGRWLVV